MKLNKRTGFFLNTILEMCQMMYACNESNRIGVSSPICNVFRIMQSSGDLEDLEQVLGKKVLRKVRGSGHCSALIKVLPKNADLLVSQVTWNDYNAMLRIYKLYRFGFHRQEHTGLIFGMHFDLHFHLSHCSLDI